MWKLRNARKKRKKEYGVLAAVLLAAMILPSGCGGDTEDTDDTESADVEIQASSEAESDSSSDDIEVFPDFTATDLEGNTITQEIFAEADITVVNIWATYCSPCIEEIPELADWYEEMPDNVQIIGIAADIENETDESMIRDAEDIIDAAGAEYTNLIPCDGLSSLLDSIPGYPTTYFVDSDGDIVDEPVYGSNVSAYQYIVEQYLDGAYDEYGDLIDEE